MTPTVLNTKTATSLICIWARARANGRLECRWMQAAIVACSEAPTGAAAAA